jgi:hypothetical protein
MGSDLFQPGRCQNGRDARRGQPCAIVADPHFLRHVVSPLQDNDLTHDDGVIDTISPVEDPAWFKKRGSAEPLSGIRPPTPTRHPSPATGCAIVADPHFLRHVVSPLRDNDLTHDDGVIDTISPVEDPAWFSGIVVSRTAKERPFAE